MSGTPHPTRAARRPRVRLVAAVAVLAGLLALSGSQCADRMGADMHPGPGASAAMMLDTAQTSGHPDGPQDTSGVLVLCLAFLFAAVAAAAGLRPSWPRIVAALRQSGRGRVIRAVPVQAPSLAQLCLLRA